MNSPNSTERYAPDTRRGATLDAVLATQLNLPGTCVQIRPHPRIAPLAFPGAAFDVGNAQLCEACASEASNDERSAGAKHRAQDQPLCERYPRAWSPRQPKPKRND